MKERNQGVITSFVGMIANFGLFVSKLVIAKLFNSVAIMADSMNNLSDLLSSTIAFFGFNIASKPADNEHPFGHERFEYISGFLMSIIMIYIGLDLLRTSFGVIINPQTLVLDNLMVFIMLLSIAVKGFLYFYYYYKNRTVKSNVLVAVAKDSGNDVIINIAILLSFLIKYMFNIELDGYIGLIIALFIIISSLVMLKGFMDDLIGIRPSQDLINQVSKIVDANDSVFSYHDLLIHEYGDHTYYGTIHIEVDQRMSLTKAHHVADVIESEVLKVTKVNLVVHIDPIDLVSDEIKAVHELVKQSLFRLDDRYRFHDFRIHENILEFDLVIYDLHKYTKEEIQDYLFNELKGKYELNIIFDTVQLTETK